ncbi:MAG: GNAT family N-acetyltransferase [Elusimicrobiota bacterium]
MVNAVSLRAPSADDVEVFYRHQLEPEACLMASFPPRDRAAFTAHWAKTAADASNTRLTIECDGKPAGYVACFSRMGLREVCYWIGGEYWGKGVATKGLALFLERVQERPFHARVAKSNVGSLRVVQKCGFVVVAEEQYAGHDGVQIEEFILKLG